VDLAAGRSLPPVGDHDRLLASAADHHMWGLLWSRVQAGQLEGPAEWVTALAQRDVLTRAHHRRLWHALTDIGTRLGDIGVEFAVIKGVPVEQQWYDRMGERPCVDLDVLVHPDRTSDLEMIIGALDPRHPLRSSFQGIFDRGLYQSLTLDVGGLSVDLHCDLLKLGPPSRHPHRLWEHTVPLVGPEEVLVRVLDPELTVVHLLLHINRDSFCWLLGYADVARIVNRSRLDWDAVSRLVSEQGVEVPVWNSLSAVMSALSTPAIAVPVASGWRCRVWRVVWRPSVRLDGDLGWARGRHKPLWLPWLVREGGAEAARWAWGQLTLSEPMVAYANPPARGPWWWRLIRGRLARLIARRRAIVALRRGASR
jgi:hypothetical protein